MIRSGEEPVSDNQAQNPTARPIRRFSFEMAATDLVLGPGEVPAKSRALAVMSASVGLSIALAVGAANLLERKDYFRSVDTFLQSNVGLSALAVVVTAIILVLGIILALSAFGGMILVLSSSSKRSYIGHAWRGALLVVLGVALYFVGKAVG